MVYRTVYQVKFWISDNYTHILHFEVTYALKAAEYPLRHQMNSQSEYCIFSTKLREKYRVFMENFDRKIKISKWGMCVHSVFFNKCQNFPKNSEKPTRSFGACPCQRTAGNCMFTGTLVFLSFSENSGNNRKKRYVHTFLI